MNNALSGKTMENVRKHRDIKLFTIERRRNHLVSEPNYHIRTFLTENLLAIEMRKRKYKWIKNFLRLSILESSKRIMYEVWYDYVKRKYDMKAKLCYMDRDA